MTLHHSPEASVSEQLAAWLSSVTRADLPDATVETARKLFVDVVGLCVAARNETYIAATLAAVDRNGSCLAFGHGADFDAFGAALVNGTAAHGEDYDDTFEGGPVHSGAVVVPAVLAACQREGLGGDRLLIGIATGVELMCRLALVTPKAIHKAGFHPTATLGALAATAGVAAALGLSAGETASALGIAGSMSAGIIEYLADGSWTKRMHAGWAAQSGLRAALMARGGFVGPRTVLEGSHGFFKAFAPSREPAFAPLFADLGSRWLMADIAFKPFACGTMTQPFIDCAMALSARGIDADEIEDLLCSVGEGTVHRLWEPLAMKQQPPTAYAAKFSTPYCVAVGFLRHKAGLAEFTDETIVDPAILSLAGKVRYEIDPDDEYPRNFTGRIQARLKDGRTEEARQPFMRGGAHAPLTGAQIERKFTDNALFGGWSEGTAQRFLDLSATLFAAPSLSGLKEIAA